MDRRSFLKTSALGGTAAAATSLAAPAYAQGNRTLTMVTSVPDGFAVFDDAAQRLADLITAMTDGALTIEKKPAGSLVGALEVFDAVCWLGALSRGFPTGGEKARVDRAVVFAGKTFERQLDKSVVVGAEFFI